MYLFRLQIYDGEDIIRHYCGKRYQGLQPIRLETNVMTVQFHADSNYIKAKFKMSYSIQESKMSTYMYGIRYNKHTCFNKLNVFLHILSFSF